MSLLPLIIELLCGAAGGNIAGKLLKNLDMGTVGNSLAGIVGGGLGGQLINLLGTTTGAAAAPDAGSIIGGIASGGVGGAVLMAIVGAMRKAMSRQ
jgi:uncharacterized membrane protein YeaQ/YmgE (transglycosylase-associated protein family)